MAQILTFPSSPAEKSLLPSGLYRTQKTEPECPGRVLINLAPAISHNLTIP